MVTLSIAAAIGIWLGLQWFACALMSNADDRGRSDPPPPPASLPDPHPISWRFVTASVVVMVIAIAASTIWPMGFGS